MKIDFECLKYGDERARELFKILNTNKLETLNWTNIDFKSSLPFNEHIVLFSEIERALSGIWIFSEIPPNKRRQSKIMDENDIQRILKELSLFYVCANYILHLEKTTHDSAKELLNKQKKSLRSRAHAFFESKVLYEKTKNSAVFNDLLNPIQQCKIDLGNIEDSFNSFRPTLFDIHKYIINNVIENAEPHLNHSRLADVNLFFNRIIISSNGKHLKITEPLAKKLNKYFYQQGYIDYCDKLLPLGQKALKYNTLKTPDEFIDYKDALTKLMGKIDSTTEIPPSTMSYDEIHTFLSPVLPYQYEKLLCVLITLSEKSLVQQLPNWESYVSLKDSLIANYCIVIYLISNGKHWTNCKVAREMIFLSLNNLLISRTFTSELYEGLDIIKKDLRKRIFLSKTGGSLDVFYNKNVKKNFGDRLKKHLKIPIKVNGNFRTFTQQELGNQLNLSQQSISKILTNKNDSIDLGIFLETTSNTGLGDAYLLSQSDTPGKLVNGLIKATRKLPHCIDKK